MKHAKLPAACHPAPGMTGAGDNRVQRGTDGGATRKVVLYFLCSCPAKGKSVVATSGSRVGTNGVTFVINAIRLSAKRKTRRSTACARTGISSCSCSRSWRTAARCKPLWSPLDWTNARSRRGSTMQGNTAKTELGVDNGISGFILASCYPNVILKRCPVNIWTVGEEGNIKHARAGIISDGILRAWRKDLTKKIYG